MVFGPGDGSPLRFKQQSWTFQALLPFFRPPSSLCGGDFAAAGADGGLEVKPLPVRAGREETGEACFLSLQVKSVINLLFAAYTGDITALRR